MSRVSNERPVRLSSSPRASVDQAVEACRTPASASLEWNPASKPRLNRSTSLPGVERRPRALSNLSAPTRQSVVVRRKHKTSPTFNTSSPLCIKQTSAQTSAKEPVKAQKPKIYYIDTVALQDIVKTRKGVYVTLQPDPSLPPAVTRLEYRVEGLARDFPGWQTNNQTKRELLNKARYECDWSVDASGHVQIIKLGSLGYLDQRPIAWSTKTTPTIAEKALERGRDIAGEVVFFAIMTPFGILEGAKEVAAKVLFHGWHP